MALTDYTHRVAEQVGDLTRAMFPFTWSSMSGIRGASRGVSGLKFWDTRHPRDEGSEVNYEMTRSLYRNDGDMGLAGGFSKPIVDIQVSFMGLPTAATGNPAQDDFLNECLHIYWVDEIQQMFRDAIRDSKCIVRLQMPDILDPLMTIEESEHRMLEILPPERVDLEYDARNKNIVRRALVRHRMMVVTSDGDPAAGTDPVVEEQDVIEIVEAERIRFFNQTTSNWMDGFDSRNPMGFVPFLEVYNEWDSSLAGGQSDLEVVIPFLRAFHDVLTQSLQAHKYHSTPKLKLNLQDVGQFMANNFPTVIDPDTGTVREGAEVSLNGREIYFFQGEEDAKFLEATSVLGDSKTLLEFLIDCICIASQTPEWAFMRVDSGSANSDRNAQTVPLTKKVDRKRRNFTKPVQQLLKMALASRDLIPVRAELSWDTIRADDAVVEAQGFQQMVMGLEAAYQSGQISSETYMQEIRRFLPAMKSISAEKRGTMVPPPPPPVVAALPPGNTPPVKGGPQGTNE